MHKRELQKLLKQLTDQSLSPAEAQKLKAWISRNGMTSIREMMDEDWESLDKIKPRRQPFPISSRWVAVAATIALLIIAGIAYQTLLHPPSEQIELVNNTFNKKEVQLPDGSTIWLNRNSKLTYSRPFDQKGRTVELEGEAFFEVQSDPARPFFVHAKAVTTKVLGTSFNIEAYPEKERIAVSLVEGSVKVHITDKDSIILKPGQQFSYDEKTGKGVTEAFLSDEPYAWKNGVIYFNKAPVEEVISTLERWYDIRFELERREIIATQLVHRVEVGKRSLEEVLEDISEVADYTFERQSNELILIKPKAKK